MGQIERYIRLQFGNSNSLSVFADFSDTYESSANWKNLRLDFIQRQLGYFSFFPQISQRVVNESALTVKVAAQLMNAGEGQAKTVLKPLFRFVRLTKKDFLGFLPLRRQLEHDPAIRFLVDLKAQDKKSALTWNSYVEDLISKGLARNLRSILDERRKESVPALIGLTDPQLEGFIHPLIRMRADDSGQGLEELLQEENPGLEAEFVARVIAVDFPSQPKTNMLVATTSDGISPDVFNRTKWVFEEMRTAALRIKEDPKVFEALKNKLAEEPEVDIINLKSLELPNP